MGKYPRNQTGRSSSGASFGMHNSYNKKRNYAPRNPPTPFRPQEDMAFDARANSRYDIVPHGPPPHFWGWQARPGRPFGNFNSPPFRPYDSTPPAVPYDFPPQPVYPPMPYIVDRGFGGQFRRSAEHGYPDLQNRLFLEEYRFPSPHPVYQPPHFGAAIHQAHFDQMLKGEGPCELDGKPLAQSIKLRGDAPEFIPGCKPAGEEELKSKAKEPCWLVVSSA